MRGDKMIEVNHLSFAYDPAEPVLSDICFQAGRGETIGLIGANGAGKSTFLRMLVGLELSFEGEILIAGERLEKKNLDQVRSRIGYVFQDSDSQLFMTTVEEDVAFAPRNYGFPEEEVRRRVDMALEKVHIEHLRGKSIYKLSGGEKKRAAIATILSMDPEVILMDEPSAALDPKNRRNLIHVINGLEGTRIIASHDLDFIRDTCERTVLLSEGRIIYDGPSQKVLQDRELLEAHNLELPLSLMHVITHTHDGSTHTHMFVHEHAAEHGKDHGTGHGADHGTGHEAMHQADHGTGHETEHGASGIDD
ncbi:MAG: ATP-binding cassette domain-containing protein [Blautia sp.]|nr:ATP-binding cassette domain-containing protein [Blautia sp.]